MKFPYPIILGALLLITGPAQARMYKWVDENGKTHITNDLSKVPRSQRGKFKPHKPPERKTPAPEGPRSSLKPSTSPEPAPAPVSEPPSNSEEYPEARAHIERREQDVAAAREKYRNLKARLAEINLMKKIDSIERQRYFDKHKDEFRQLELEALRLENEIMDAWGELTSQESKLQREITNWENEKKRRSEK